MALLRGRIVRRGLEGSRIRRMSVGYRALRPHGHEVLAKEDGDDGFPLGVAEFVEEGAVEAVLLFPKAQEVLTSPLAALEEVGDSSWVRPSPGSGSDKVDDDIAGGDELVELLYEISISILKLFLKDGLDRHGLKTRCQHRAVAAKLAGDGGKEEAMGIECRHGSILDCGGTNATHSNDKVSYPRRK